MRGGHADHRGAAPVGYLAELPPVEAGAVFYFRMWCDQSGAQVSLHDHFVTVLGGPEGREVARTFDMLCDLCVRHGRRPLTGHAVNCECLGADECCFANFIGYASDGDREEALMMAMTMVTPHIAPVLLGLAETFGLALRRMMVRKTVALQGPVLVH